MADWKTHFNLPKQSGEIEIVVIEEAIHFPVAEITKKIVLQKNKIWFLNYELKTETLINKYHKVIIRLALWEHVVYQLVHILSKQRRKGINDESIFCIPTDAIDKLKNLSACLGFTLEQRYKKKSL